MWKILHIFFFLHLFLAGNGRKCCVKVITRKMYVWCISHSSWRNWTTTEKLYHLCVCMCSFLRGLILVNVVSSFFCWLLLMLLIFQYLQPTFKNHNFPIRMREETICLCRKTPIYSTIEDSKKGWKISQENLIWFFRFCFLGVVTFLKLLLVHDLWSKFCLVGVYFICMYDCDTLGII